MNIAFFGTPQEVTSILDALIKHFPVSLVITTPDQPTGRKQQITPTPVKKTALANAIPVLQPVKLDETVAQQIQEKKIDLIIVASYGKIIPQNILSVPNYGAINIHPSLLPKFRGPTPIQTTLIQQEKETGITFIKMDAQMDHGPILKQIPYSLQSDDTFESLMKGMFGKAAEILPEFIMDYTNSSLLPLPQDENAATYTKTITKKDGYLDIQKVPEKKLLTAMIHAYYPWPGVWTVIKSNGKDIRIKLLPGQKLQIEGKSVVTKKDFINGYPDLKEFVEKIY